MSVTHLARPEIIGMKPYSSARSETGSGGVLLNANELPWPLLEDPWKDHSSAGSFNRYPEPQHAGLIGRLTDEYKVPADHILLTRGSDDGIDLLVRVFCRAGQDAILDCPPSFGMYRIAAQIQGAQITTIARVPDSLELDTENILNVTRGPEPPRLIFLTSPANPTGDLVEVEFLERLLQATAGRSIVVVDEAYAEFTNQDSFASLIDQHEQLVVLRTLSKGFASAALRCGALLATPVVIDLLRRVMPPYPLATPVINLANQLFEPQIRDLQKAMLQKIRENKLILIAVLENRPFVKRIWPGQANFVLARVTDAADLVQHCANANVTIRMFSGNPILKNCIRISVGKASELKKLGSALDCYKPGSKTIDTEA